MIALDKTSVLVAPEGVPPLVAITTSVASATTVTTTAPAADQSRWVAVWRWCVKAMRLIIEVLNKPIF